MFVTVDGLSRNDKVNARLLARRAWMAAGGDMKKAKKLARQEVKETYGSIVLFITIAAAVLQLAYYFIKIWKELNLVDPGYSEIRTGEKQLLLLKQGVRW